MTATELFADLARLSGVTFVVSSMLAMGLSLTVSEIAAPLRDVRVIITALWANFVLVPALAYGIAKLFSLDQPLENGLILLGAAAGAPFLPKLVQGARANVAFGVGLMVLLMVATVAYLPLVLPLLLPGVTVKPWDIAKSLIVVMLIPLAIGLLWRAHLEEDAARWQPVFAKASSIAVLVLLVVGFGVNASNVLALVGTGGIAALLLLTLGALGVGLLFGGSDRAQRDVLALGTGFRNFSAAIIVATQSFAGTATVSFVLVGGLVFLLVMLPAARLMGRRTGHTPAMAH